MPMKLGYSTWGMPEVPIDIILPHLSKLGYDGVEITVIPRYTTRLEDLDRDERKRILNLLQENRLELPAIAGHTPLMAKDPDEHSRNMDRLRRTIDLAVDWAQPQGPPCLDTTAGGRPEDWEVDRDLLAERTAELAEYAAERGVVLAMEPHVGSIIDTPQKMLELIELVPGVRTNFDISHFNVMGISIQESVSLMAPHTAHTHVKDEKGTVPDFEFLIPGEGEFDYVTYLKEMERAGYDGYISAEVSVMVQRRPNYDALDAAAKTYATLDGAFRAAGIERG